MLVISMQSHDVRAISITEVRPGRIFVDRIGVVIEILNEDYS